MNKILTKLVLFLGLAGVSSCQTPVKLGNVEITVPAGWRKTNTEKERINFVSDDDRQQATVSIMTFDAVPSFADFKRICSHRLEAEKAEAPNIVIDDDEPFEDAGTFGMFFSGKEASSGRLFSGYITQKGVETHTVYVESIDVETKRHFASFEAFVKGLKRR